MRPGVQIHEKKKLAASFIDKIETGFSEPPNDEDVIVLFKQNISDTHFCGVPVVCLPITRVTRLRYSVPQVAPRHTLSDTTLKELEKTADVISQEPWAMTSAATYLREFVHGNRSGSATRGGIPPDIAWVWSKQSEIEIVPESRISAESLVPTQMPQTVKVGSRTATKSAPVSKASASARVSKTASASRSAPVSKAAFASGSAPVSKAALASGSAPVVKASGSAPVPKATAATKKAAAKAKEKVKHICPADIAHLPPEVISKLGCAKCRRSKNGCRKCRGRNCVFNVDGQWQYLPDRVDTEK